MERDDAGPVSQQDAAAYEVARDILSELLGYAARELDAGDPAEGAVWRSRRDDWATRLRDLRPYDALAVRRVLEEDAAFLRALSND
jgi:hypothetical protein